MADRRDPDAMSWKITADTIFREEREHYGLEGDYVFIERFDDETETWQALDNGDSLRLTIQRADSVG